MPPLLLSQRFAPLFCCQFFAAFNDNFLKTALVFLILYGSRTGSEELITLAGAVFIAPYFFLSALGGELADRYDKARLAQRLKFAELFVAAAAAVGYGMGSVAAVFAALAGFGVIAALFGPIKYGILPDHLPRERLPAANALIEGATFIAILTGTIAGGLSGHHGSDAWNFAVLILAFALAAWAASLLIPPTGEAAPRLEISLNVARSTAALIRHLRRDGRLWWGAMVTSWFWLVGIVVLSLLPPLIKNFIAGDEDAAVVYLTIFSIAVSGGSWLAAVISRGRIMLGITVVGACLLGIFLLDLGIGVWGRAVEIGLRGPAQVFAAFAGLRVAFDLCGLAVAGGLFIVPAFAAVQAWAGVDYRARTVAAVNVLNAAAMTAATLVVAILQKAGVGIPALIVATGIVTLVVAAAIWRTLPNV